jgi:para-aminobenzoate synthetase/4-amino-4-deoxychorismate lyase
MKQKILNDNQVASLLGSLGEQQDFVFLDTSMPDSTNRRSLLFTRPLARLRFFAGDSRRDFLEQAAARLEQGCYLAGWLAYEFLHEKHQINQPDSGAVLADFGVYPAPSYFDHAQGGTDFPLVGPDGSNGPANAGYRIDNLRSSMEEEPYCRAIERILEYIAAGDTYQVNYTFKLSFDFDGSVAGLYRDLRRSQPVPYGSFIKQGDHHILSFSPELFFRLEGGRIIARPMKGTMKRGRYGAEDRGITRLLSSDVKNRSENVMIVDLLRNDLSRLVDDTGGGTVGVASLFDVERYRTVFQMTSTIVAQRFEKGPVRPAQILDAIFPCGSVTGAPKIRTMEIIEELETQQRGVYTGGIGYFSPDGDAAFNVPIRTLVIQGDSGEMGIGSGIVADSTPREEWRECLLKARFLTSLPPRFELIETMLYDPESGFLFGDRHLGRMRNSADYLGLAFDEEQLRSLLDDFASSAVQSCQRVRLTLSGEGEAALRAAACERPASLSLAEACICRTAGSIALAEETMQSSSSWLFHKTTQRQTYDAAHRQAAEAGLLDLIFRNERSEITEGAITTIIIEKNGRFFTPPIDCGVLPGVMRAVLLEDKAGSGLEERVLYEEDLKSADRLYICNSVRGVLPVKLA